MTCLGDPSLVLPQGEGEGILRQGPEIGISALHLEGAVEGGDLEVPRGPWRLRRSE